MLAIGNISWIGREAVRGKYEQVGDDSETARGILRYRTPKFGIAGYGSGMSLSSSGKDRNISSAEMSSSSSGMSGVEFSRYSDFSVKVDSTRSISFINLFLSDVKMVI
jgi:hypothetical protein